MDKLKDDIKSFVTEDAAAIETRNEALARVLLWTSSSKTPQENLTSLVTTHLAPYLASEGKDAARGRATLLLGRVVADLVKRGGGGGGGGDFVHSVIGTDAGEPTLNASTISFLCQFFCGRMESDYGSVQGCLEALLSLASPERSGSMSATIAERMSMLASLQKLHVPQMAVNLRILSHHLFDVLVNDDEICAQIRTKSKKNYSNEIVEQFCDAMNQESDPRCLKRCFGTATRLMTAFENDLSNESVEKMFEVLECYVPIEFTPPPNDIRGITQNDLVLGLRGFFSCSARLADDVVDMVRERLESEDSTATARLDVLRTLGDALPIFCSSNGNKGNKDGDNEVEDDALPWVKTTLVQVLQATIEEVMSGAGDDEVVLEAALRLVHVVSQLSAVCPALVPCCLSLLSTFVKESFQEAETFRASSSLRGVI
jgi:hypothetical protein